MNRPLSGARLKLARADEHLNELVADHERFMERNPYRVLGETQPGNNEWTMRVKVMEEPPRERWAAIIGDCIHTLRSALDHTAYALVGQTRTPPNTTEFPIFKDRTKWDDDHAKKLPGVSPKVLTQAKWLQPYRRYEDADPLWILRELDVIDKHRRLHIVTSTLEGSRFAVAGTETIDINPCLGPFKDGTEVGRFTIADPSSEVNVNAEFTFGIAFGEGEPAEKVPVPMLLKNLVAYVGGVISLFERFV